MLVESVLALLFISYLHWLYTRYHRVWKHIAKIPGPPAVPIFGNILQVGRTLEDYFVQLNRWEKEYNFHVHRVYGGPKPYVVLIDPKYAEIVLSSPILTYKEDIYEFLMPWLGEGLLTSNGQKWVKHRKMITPSFHFQILQDYFHIINEVSNRFMKLLATYAEDENIFDIQEVITRSTIDIICESAMGIKMKTIEGEQSIIVKAIEEICDVVTEQIFSLVGRMGLVFQLTKNYRKRSNAIKIMREEMFKIIKNRRKIMKDIEINMKQKTESFVRPKMAFLDNLLTAEIDGRPLTLNEIYDEVSTFLFEGHDTTASALGFAAFCLSRHPHVQDKVLKEQQELFGSDLNRHPTYQELSEMKYLEMVIKEVLRLFPSVPFIVRTLEEDTKIGDYLVPANTSVVVSIFGIGRNEKTFTNAIEFRPERFEPDERADVHPFDYVPFSAGPRNCIGQKFAMMEMKMIISKMVRNFNILPPAEGLSSGIHDLGDPLYKPRCPYDPKLVGTVTLKSSNGLSIRLSKRQY